MPASLGISEPITRALFHWRTTRLYPARAIPRRAPELNEHGDAILGELGLDWDAIIDLKARGVVA